ncbi:MAG: type II secretion system protein [Planctomycetota bacterium]|nr:type II secretion system protein [Planctomycetota bacterium]
MRCARCWRQRGRGFTLVEAVVGTAILGSVLAAVLLASARMQVQARRAAERTEACRVADELLESWWPKRDKMPLESEERVPGRKGWTWRARTVRRETLGGLEAETIAVEVFREGQAGGEPAARVEVMLPNASADEKSADAR